MKNLRSTTPAKKPAHANHEPLPLDLETAPEHGRKPLGYRAYIGGILYLEGVIVLLIGMTLLASYWPPVEAHGEPANPVSRLGMWLVVGSLVYMVGIGGIIFIYNLFRPSYSARPETAESGAVARARRYSSMKRRTFYIFDDTVRCEKDADEAMHARNLY